MSAVTTAWGQGTRETADRIRRRVFAHTLTNNGGYLSHACSSAEMLALLYTRVLRLGDSTAPLVPGPFPGVPGPDSPSYTNGGAYNGPKAPDLDRFIFSPAHCALVLYSTLIEVGRARRGGPRVVQRRRQHFRDDRRGALAGRGDDHRLARPGHQPRRRHRPGPQAPRRHRPGVGDDVRRRVPGGPGVGGLRRLRVLARGEDVTVVTAGITTEEAMRATAALARVGVGVNHLHVSTHKPLRDPRLLEAMEASRHGVVTLENHTIVGGLGWAVAELMAEAGSGKRLVRLGLRDTYAHGASKPYLMREYGLDAPALVGGVEQLLGRSTGVTDSELDAVRVEQTHSLAKAEAL